MEVNHVTHQTKIHNTQFFGGQAIDSMTLQLSLVRIKIDGKMDSGFTLTDTRVEYEKKEGDLTLGVGLGEGTHERHPHD